MASEAMSAAMIGTVRGTTMGRAVMAQAMRPEHTMATVAATSRTSSKDPRTCPLR